MEYPSGHRQLRMTYARVSERGTPDVEARLRQTTIQLKKTIANQNKEPERLRTDVPTLVRGAPGPPGAPLNPLAPAGKPG